MSKLFLMLGTINAAAAVSMGAFGAHFLKNEKMMLPSAPMNGISISKPEIRLY